LSGLLGSGFFAQLSVASHPNFSNSINHFLFIHLQEGNCSKFEKLTILTTFKSLNLTLKDGIYPSFLSRIVITLILLILDKYTEDI